MTKLEKLYNTIQNLKELGLEFSVSDGLCTEQAAEFTFVKQA